MSILTYILISFLCDLFFCVIFLFIVYRAHKDDKTRKISDNEYEEFLEWYKNKKK